MNKYEQLNSKRVRVVCIVLCIANCAMCVHSSNATFRFGLYTATFLLKGQFNQSFKSPDFVMSKRARQSKRHFTNSHHNDDDDDVLTNMHCERSNGNNNTPKATPQRYTAYEKSRAKCFGSFAYHFISFEALTTTGTHFIPSATCTYFNVFSTDICSVLRFLFNLKDILEGVSIEVSKLNGI